MSLSINIEAPGLREAEKALAGIRNGFPKAVSRSINSALLAGRTATSKLIRERYNITAANIKGAMEMKKANTSDLSGALGAKGPMLPLTAFKPKARKVKGSHQEVYAAIVKGKRKLIKGAFMPPSGRVMERRQPERFPIFPVMTIGIPLMVGSKNLSEKIEDRMSQAYATALKYNVAFYLKKKA